MKSLRVSIMIVFIGLAFVLTQGTLEASQGNWSANNMEGDSPFQGEWKSRISPQERAEKKAQKKQDSGPTFWDKEMERSGFGRMGRRIKENFKKMAEARQNAAESQAFQVTSTDKDMPAVQDTKFNFSPRRRSEETYVK